MMWQLRWTVLAGGVLAVSGLGTTPAAAQETAAMLDVGLSEAIGRCDEAAFDELKPRLMAALNREIAASPGNTRLIEMRDRTAVQLFPEPCPPEEEARDDFAAGLAWLPIRDIRFRGNYRRAVRAPNVIDLFASTRSIDVEPTGIGVTRDGPPGGAPEQFAGFTRDKVTLWGGGGAIHFGRFSVGASYESGSAGSLFDLPPIPGGFNGAVFGEFSPAGSTGIGSGSASLAGSTRTHVSRFKAGGDVALVTPTPRTRVFFEFDYFRDVIRHDMSLQGTVQFPNQTITFSQTREQRITDNFFLAGPGAEVRLPLTPDRPDGTGLSLRFNGTAQVFYLDSNFLSSESNLSNFGPASDQSFVITIDQSEHKFGVTGRGQVNLEYVFSPGFALFAGGQAEWFSDGGAVSNPNSGDQVLNSLFTRPQSKSFVTFGGFLGARFRF